MLNNKRVYIDQDVIDSPYSISGPPRLARPPRPRPCLSGMNVEPKIQILKSNSNCTHRAVREVHCTNAIQPSFTTLWGLMQNCSGIIPSKTTGHAVYKGDIHKLNICQIFGIFSKFGHYYCTHFVETKLNDCKFI